MAAVLKAYSPKVYQPVGARVERDTGRVHSRLGPIVAPCPYRSFAIGRLASRLRFCVDGVIDADVATMPSIESPKGAKRRRFACSQAGGDVSLLLGLTLLCPITGLGAFVWCGDR